MSIIINNIENLNATNIFGLMALLVSDLNTNTINIGEITETSCEIEECGICLQVRKYSKKIKLICGHIFHKRCINKYRKERLECPLCRTIQLR